MEKTLTLKTIGGHAPLGATAMGIRPPMVAFPHDSLGKSMNRGQKPIAGGPSGAAPPPRVFTGSMFSIHSRRIRFGPP